jgi:transcriptional regulator of nitric oxide reductase
MTRKVIVPVMVAVMAVGAWGAGLAAQASQTALGSVRLARGVMADGRPLAAGTYALRVSTDAVTSVVGQAADNAKWVEFVQNGQVKGRELASVVTAAEVKDVIRGTAPAAGTTRSELLKGGEYLRIWANRSGNHYLIHLVVGS